jgi:hypothetical protein
MIKFYSDTIFSDYNYDAVDRLKWKDNLSKQLLFYKIADKLFPYLRHVYHQRNNSAYYRSETKNTISQIKRKMGNEKAGRID